MTVLVSLSALEKKNNCQIPLDMHFVSWLCERHCLALQIIFKPDMGKLDLCSVVMRFTVCEGGLRFLLSLGRSNLATEPITSSSDDLVNMTLFLK